MNQLYLIPINQSDEVAEEVGALPEIARQVCEAMASLYQTMGFAPPWIGYLARLDGAVVGTCAFKSPPHDGRVEVAYFTFPEYEGRGIATAMARELIAIAQAAQPGILVTAQTLPEPNASGSILKKLGFQFAGSVMHPEDGEVWEWHLSTP